MQATNVLDVASLPLLLTPDEASQVLRIPKSTVYDLAARGQLPRIKLGRTVRFPREALLRHIQAATSES